MKSLNKWDMHVITNGNREKWRSSRSWFGISLLRTLYKVVGAWGRKRNLLKSGSWKGSNVWSWVWWRLFSQWPKKQAASPLQLSPLWGSMSQGKATISTCNRQLHDKSKTDESSGGPYLGIVSSRYCSFVMCAKENVGKKGKSNGGTDLKISTQNLFTDAMEAFWHSIRQKAWTMFHPPPSPT